jgi:hypothetical protein
MVLLPYAGAAAIRNGAPSQSDGSAWADPQQASNTPMPAVARRSEKSIMRLVIIISLRRQRPEQLPNAAD